MSLLGLALIGKANEPLYLCDCTNFFDPTMGAVTTSSDATENDFYGFQEKKQERGMSQSMSFEHQLMVHSALDVLEERMGPCNLDGSMNVRRGIEGSTPITTRWAGVLFREGDIRVYGHVTATNAKCMAVVVGDGLENEVKALLASVHLAYVRYIMNPLNSTEKLGKQEVHCPTFDKNIRLSIEDYRTNISTN